MQPIHHILTNPIYAGRIRHRREAYEGQHPAIIAPARWDALQLRLQDGAARSRGKASAAARSRLAGKVFDETGDRLSPSHSRTRAGARLRHYISHRLMSRSGEAGVDGWRLPAVELEARIAWLVKALLTDASLPARLAVEAEGIARLRKALDDLVTRSEDHLLALVSRIDLSPGKITVALCPGKVADELALDPDALDALSLRTASAFQLRKRGVETGLVLADAPPVRDQTLIRNIALAHRWFELIRSGRTFGEISQAEGVSKSRIQHLIDLAFLAPDILRDVLEGRQPIGFTSEWCVRHSVPSDWADQRRLLATL